MKKITLKCKMTVITPFGKFERYIAEKEYFKTYNFYRKCLRNKNKEPLAMPTGGFNLVIIPKEVLKNSIITFEQESEKSYN